MGVGAETPPWPAAVTLGCASCAVFMEGSVNSSLGTEADGPWSLVTVYFLGEFHVPCEEI